MSEQSEIDVSTWLGGNCCVPIACRSKPSTTMIRTKHVVISSIDRRQADHGEQQQHLQRRAEPLGLVHRSGPPPRPRGQLRSSLPQVRLFLGHRRADEAEADQQAPRASRGSGGSVARLLLARAGTRETFGRGRRRGRRDLRRTSGDPRRSANAVSTDIIILTIASPEHGSASQCIVRGLAPHAARRPPSDAIFAELTKHLAEGMASPSWRAIDGKCRPADRLRPDRRSRKGFPLRRP